MKKSLLIGMTVLLIFGLINNPVSAQTDWAKYTGNPVMETGAAGSWDASALECHCVINNGAIYEMWYSGFVSGLWQIGHATSPHGLVWTKNASNPVLSPGATGEWDTAEAGGPHILYDGTTYKMWYTGKNASGVSAVGYATSTDGIEWTKYANNPIIEISQAWEGNDLYDPVVIFDGTSYKMWYQSFGTIPAIGYATSDDGITWIKHENNPVFEPTAGQWDFSGVAYPNVIFEDELYHLWYTGMGPGGFGDWEKGYATSTDGIDWTKDAENPVLNPGPESYDYRGLWASSTLYEDGVYKMWYVGKPSSYSNMNYATSIPTSIDGSDNRNPNRFILSQNYPNPFNPTTTIRYSLPEASVITLTVSDIQGYEVITLQNASKPQGNYQVQWNGIDALGNQVSTGVYFARLKAGSMSQTIKMVYLR